MPLVPCESCRRHVRASEDACPFCKTVRVGQKAAVVATSAFMLAACFSPGAKYGGPPAPAPPDTTTTTVTIPEAGPVDTAAPTATADIPDASPRLTDTPPDAGKHFAPVALYGGPPRKKTIPNP